MAPSNPSDQQTNSLYKTVHLSLRGAEQLQPITIVARLQVEWKKNQLRFALMFQLVPAVRHRKLVLFLIPNLVIFAYLQGWSEPNETDWSNLSSRDTGISSDQTFLFVQSTTFDFYERLAFDWSTNYTETIECKEKGWNFLLGKLNCKHLIAEDLADMFIALIGLQNCLVRVFMNETKWRSVTNWRYIQSN